MAQAAYEAACQYAEQRRTFGAAIKEHQAVAFMLADMMTEIEASRWLVYRAAWLRDQGRPYTKEASIAKLFATEAAERIARNAIQIHGGYGYSRQYPVERIYRDARLMTIGEGTSEVQRMVISRSAVTGGRREGAWRKNILSSNLLGRRLTGTCGPDGS